MKKTIFDYINSILYKNAINEPIHTNNSEYNQYMINRWLSMYSSDMANIVNSTVNVYGTILDNQEHYNLLYNLIPKCKSKKINYLKASKTTVDEEIKDLSEINELSCREIQDSLQLAFVSQQ
jgi:hypothetical protein